VATDSQTIALLLEQLAGLEDASARRMFGEYALYCRGKVVALVCDDQLFVKPTEAGRRLLGEPVLAPAYPGARDSFLVTADLWEDGDRLAELIARTAAELPMPKPKAPKKRKAG